MGAAKEDLKAKQAIKDAEAKRRGTSYFYITIPLPSLYRLSL